MASAIIFLDESGDLGWTFHKPYRFGGSSRFLSIGAICCPLDEQHVPARLVRSLYRDRGWNPRHEKKWTKMSPEDRTAFAWAAVKMLKAHPNISLHAAVARKESVADHIRTDPNKLCNHLIEACILNKLAGFDDVTLVPDPRSVKVASSNTLPDHLQMKLWFELGVTTTVESKPRDSASSLQVQCADMLAGLVRSRYEDGDLADFHTLSPVLETSLRFFE